MEYLVFWGAFALFLVFIFVKGAWDARSSRRKFEKRLFDQYGQAPEREYKLERFARIDSYFRKHPREGQIDDITWNDLSMDEVFKRMNYTLSSTGEEYLYYTLRTPRMEEGELEHLEEMVRYFDQNGRSRVDVQLLLWQLGNMGNYSLYDYLQFLGDLGKRSNWKHFLSDLLILFSLFFCMIQFSVGILGVVMLIVYNIVTYYKEKAEIEPYVVSFSYIMRLLDACGRLVELPVPVCEKEWQEIKEHALRLASMKKGSFLVLSGGNGLSSGNPLEILLDYFRMAFHVDIIVFNRMLYLLNRHLDDVDVLVGQVGRVETAICIASYRASLTAAACEKPGYGEAGNPFGQKPAGGTDGQNPGGLGSSGWCVPEFLTDRVIEMRNAYHPLLEHPVKNSIHAERGVLLTGSNASGKSTFLKTTAINAILAQTIHTCLADSYRAAFFHIYSSMSLSDDLESGESYYIVEIKALKRILDAADGKIPVLCFVDEVLRGTNTVERIAASTQILKSLTGKKLLCFAATHDIELTELLKGEYDNYHFEEEIRDGDILFNYKLIEGKATTRNAIRLLELMGYEQGIIREATRQAERFVETGRWSDL